MFPAYLRAAGYYTTNNSKEDYNAQKSSDVWNDSSKRASWKNRPTDSTPFFHVLTSTLSHESSLHFDGVAMETPTVTEMASVQLQPYFPDTPIFRYTRARYHDRIMAIDQVVGKTVAELKEAGELENTFIFYFGDHGGVLPRSKGYAYESGLHVPLIVRIPENFRDRAGRQSASRTDGFVEFVDFGPTVLALAGLDSPEGIDGHAFLGDGVDSGPKSIHAMKPLVTPIGSTKSTIWCEPCAKANSSTSETLNHSFPMRCKITTATKCWPTSNGVNCTPTAS